MSVLALKLEFSEKDIDLARSILNHKGILPPFAGEDYFTQGDPVVANISEETPEESLAMCAGFMALMVGEKEKKQFTWSQ